MYPQLTDSYSRWISYRGPAMLGTLGGPFNADRARSSTVLQPHPRFDTRP